MAMEAVEAWLRAAGPVTVELPDGPFGDPEPVAMRCGKISFGDNRLITDFGRVQLVFVAGDHDGSDDRSLAVRCDRLIVHIAEDVVPPRVYSRVIDQGGVVRFVKAG